MSWKLLWQITFILGIIFYIIMFIIFAYKGFIDLIKIIKENNDKKQ